MIEPLWTRQEIEGALGRAPSRVTTPISGVSIDSRTVQPDDLFVAIKGENNDGHAFVTDALGKGAAAAIVSREYAETAGREDLKLIAVEEPLEAMNSLARTARTRTDARVVGVTGSVGKTGTKEMLRVILGAASAVHASEKSYNNLWGVPLSLARMPARTKFGVFEIGMNHAGEITPLTQLVRPHGAIVTWVDAVHIEFFESVAAIAEAKAEIFYGVESGGFAILPLDNPHFELLKTRAAARGLEVISFGKADGAQSRILEIAHGRTETHVVASILSERKEFMLRAFGEHLARNAVAALTSARLLGCSLSAAADALQTLEPPEGRGRRRTFTMPGGGLVLLIDETYNANPASMRAALSVLGSVDRESFPRRVAVLGDMLELGHGSAEFHASLAGAIDTNGIDLVFCAGKFMKSLYESLPEEKRGCHASTSEELKHSVLSEIRRGDAVMIKGSLGSKMKPIADALTAHLDTNIITGQGQEAA